MSGQDDQPLGLTVHSMPSPGLVTLGDAQRTRRGRWKMIVVMLICAAPVIASYFTYYVVRPEGRRNYGELINPQRPLPDQAATSLDGKAVNLRQLKGQWLLISVAGGACDEACRQHLYLQRQLRETLGKEKDRVDWVWIVSDDAPVAPALLPAVRDATVLRVPQAQLSQWLEPASGQHLDSHLYLVDPIGNWMMRFPAGLQLQGAANAKRDLERLLRAAASWDEPGR
ncbi:cytochrome c oxidase subunit I [soil metagenome]